MIEKFNVKRFLITLVIVVLAVFSTAGPLWYFMDKNQKDQQETINNLQDQLNQKLESQKDNEDSEKKEVSDWKTYTDKNKNYSIKYPKSWTYDDTYEVGQGFSLVAFGESKEDLPVHQSDQIAAISITSGKGESILEYYKSSEKVQISSTTIGGSTKATKVVLLPGREEEMYGDSKITYYEVKVEDNNYITVLQFEDYEQDNFDLMLKTFKLL